MTSGRVWAISAVKDEADVIEGTIRHLLAEGVDGIIVADNLSTDGTRDILSDISALNERVIVIDDPEIAFYQSEKACRMANRAYSEFGAEWIVPFDADELWWSWSGSLARTLRTADPGVRIVEAKMMNYFPTDVDPVDPSPFRSIVHRQPEHQKLTKVAVRWQEGAIIWQGAHGATLLRPGATATLLEVSHFPYRSQLQFIRKALNGAAAYKAAVDLPADVGAHWRGYGEAYERGGDAALLDIYNTWFHFHSPNDADPPLVRDPARFAG